MNYNIITSSYFDVAAKRLAKKYPSFKDDLRIFRDELLENPLQGDELSLASQDKYDEAIKYYEEYLATYSTPTATDYAGLPQLYFFKSNNETGDAQKASLKKADELYAQLGEKYADAAEYATFWRARVNNAMDDEQKNALAKPYYEKLIELYSTRTELNNSDKSRLKESYLYLISYYARVANDMAKAKECAVKLLEVDPENAVAKQVMEIK